MSCSTEIFDSMPTDSVLVSRAGGVSAHATVLTAALLAADAASPTGFRVVDVRFFFLLFTNWMEDDLLRPGVDLDLTQVRRVLARLVTERHAAAAAGRHPRYQLLPEGVLHLVDVLVDPRVSRTFEETVFLATAAASYRHAIAARARGAARAPEARVLSRLDPVRILQAERRRLEGALHDLEDRVRHGLEMEALARTGPADVEGLTALLQSQGGTYQLHPMRSFSELVSGLPDALARFELGPGMGLRARALFGPLAEQLRARISILDRLTEELRGVMKRSVR